MGFGILTFCALNMTPKNDTDEGQKDRKGLRVDPKNVLEGAEYMRIATLFSIGFGIVTFRKFLKKITFRR